MEWNSSTNDWSEITEIELATLEFVGIVACDDRADCVWTAFDITLCGLRGFCAIRLNKGPDLLN